MKRVVMLLFAPYSPDVRVRREALSLTKDGYDVHIIAWNRTDKNPPFVEDDITLHHIGPALPRDFSARSICFQVMFKYLCLKKFSKEAENISHGLGPDLVHVHDLDALSLGIDIAKRAEVPLIYDSHEMYGQMLSKFFPDFVVSILEAYEKRLLRRVDQVITVTESHMKFFMEKGAENVSVVSNYKDIDGAYFKPENGIFTIVYIGGLIHGRFLLEAAKTCSSVSGVRFVIYGSGPLESELLKISQESECVEMRGILPLKDVISETRKADVVFCMLDPRNVNNRFGPPNKLFEAMVAGRPVIATRGTYSGNVTEEENMGLTLEYDIDGFKEAVITMRDNPRLCEEMGGNALKAAEIKYNWSVCEKELLECYRRLIGGQ